MIKLNWKIMGIFGILLGLFFIDSSLWAIYPEPLNEEELKKLLEQPQRLHVDSNLLNSFTGRIEGNEITMRSISVEGFYNAIQSSQIETVPLSEWKPIQEGVLDAEGFQAISKRTEIVIREIHNHIATQEKKITEEIKQTQEDLVVWAQRASEKTSLEIQEIREITKESFPFKTFAYTQVATFAFLALLEKFFRT